METTFDAWNKQLKKSDVSKPTFLRIKIRKFLNL